MFFAALAPSAILAENVTFLRLVSEAGLFAKFILFLLLTMSVIAWGVALDKFRLYRRIEQQARAIRQEARTMRTMQELLALLDHGYSGPLMAILRESRKVLQSLGSDVAGRDYLIVDFQRASQKAILDSLHMLEKNLVVLSTTTTEIGRAHV